MRTIVANIEEALARPSLSRTAEHVADISVQTANGSPVSSDTGIDALIQQASTQAEWSIGIASPAAGSNTCITGTRANLLYCLYQFPGAWRLIDIGARASAITRGLRQLTFGAMCLLWPLASVSQRAYNSLFLRIREFLDVLETQRELSPTPAEVLDDAGESLNDTFALEPVHNPGRQIQTVTINREDPALGVYQRQDETLQSLHSVFRPFSLSSPTIPLIGGYLILSELVFLPFGYLTGSTI